MKEALQSGTGFAANVAGSDSLVGQKCHAQAATALLVAQRLDWVEIGRPPGGVQAGENPYRDRHAQGEQEGVFVKLGW